MGSDLGLDSGLAPSCGFEAGFLVLLVPALGLELGFGFRFELGFRVLGFWAGPQTLVNIIHIISYSGVARFRFFLSKTGRSNPAFLLL